MRDAYVEKLAAHRDGLAAIARAAQWSFATHRTDRPAPQALLALYAALAVPRGILMLGLLAFASPWLLLGLAVLPVLWWLLRVTPPAPRRIAFPALRLLLGLNPREETPARTPLWLILLRMVLVGADHPGAGPSAAQSDERLAGSGPLVLAVDNGWAAARQWERARDVLDRLIDQAEREGREVVLLGTAPPAGSDRAAACRCCGAADARAAADAAGAGALARGSARRAGAARPARPRSAAEIVWLSDGIDDGTARGFARGLARLGRCASWPTRRSSARISWRAAPDQGKDLAVEVRRAAAIGPTLIVRAVGEDGRLLARAAA